MRFIRESIIFLLLFVSTYWIVITIMEYATPLYNRTNTSVLHDIRDYRYYDFILMGTSHARMFGLDGQRPTIESIIGKNFTSLGYVGSGVMPQKLYLEDFYRHGNQTPRIIYMLDPWVLYSREANEKDFYTTNEVFRHEYLIGLIRDGFSPGVIKDYATKKVSYKIFILPRNLDIVLDAKMTQKEVGSLNVDIKERIKVWYSDGLSTANFKKYSKVLEDIVLLARKNNTKITILIPPTMMGDLPGEKNAKKLAKKLIVEVYDYSDTVKNPDYYLNFDHLNFDGTKYFASKYLKPLLERVD